MTYPAGININIPVTPEQALILTPEALAFIAGLARKFGPERLLLLEQRVKRQAELEAGRLFDFPANTAAVRDGDWTIAPVPPELMDRRVEITGPAERKMLINGLNAGASVYMADLEDSMTPTWHNVIEGQINLRDAVAGTITHVNPDGRTYRLNEKVSVLFVRPRGWHMVEKHMTVDGKPVSGSLFDFGLYFFHNAKALLARGSAPYFYLPKMESHLEARLWNGVFVYAQQTLGIPRGLIKATVLIETLPAAFEMDEILYELREHSAGLNCGRWDYIFSCIKKFGHIPGFILADRGLVGMTSPFMRAYSLLLIRTCHRRNAHAMGGMAAQIPIKSDSAANEAAMAKVREDKEREANDGHDGTWVAHPGLVPLAMEVFDRLMPAPNQLGKKRGDVQTTAADLMRFEPQAPITEAGLHFNIEVAIAYLGAWLSGTGCVPIHHLMEDAATAEISRSQVWQWIHSPLGVLDDGRKVTRDMVRGMIPPVLAIIDKGVSERRFIAGDYRQGAAVFEQLIAKEPIVEFLTNYCYEVME
ncbi:MAG: malate synthase A [Gallionella sp.]